METVSPDARWSFAVRIRCLDLSEMGNLLAGALETAELPLATMRADDSLAPRSPIAPRSLLSVARDLAQYMRSEGEEYSVALFAGDEQRVMYSLKHHAGVGRLVVTAQIRDWLRDRMSHRVLIEVGRRLLFGRCVSSMILERESDETYTTPTVPIASAPNVPGWDRVAVVTTRAEVAEAYERPDDFFAAGWTVEWFGEQALLTRCLDVVTRADLLREIRDHSWAMARAAKPGRTRYVWPRGTEAELPLYEEGEANLRYVGTNADGLTEYACTLRPGQHLHGWEIFELAYAVDRKQLRDGTPTNRIRVVFLDEWMAQAEKRPLLDKGIHVFYMDTDGEDVELTA